jgi:hypothetical protein
MLPSGLLRQVHRNPLLPARPLRFRGPTLDIPHLINAREWAKLFLWMAAEVFVGKNGTEKGNSLSQKRFLV